MTTRQIIEPEVVRAQVLDDGGRPLGSIWAGPAEIDGETTGPLRVVVDHISSVLPEITGWKAGQLREPTTAIAVTLARVRNRRVARAIDDACPSGGLFDLSGGRSLKLDAWVPETDTKSLRLGYGYQHWCFPRLVVSRVKQSEDPLVILDEPASIPETFATGLAIEHPEAADTHDLWWPRIVAGTVVLPPVRAYQWVRELAVPPVPV